MSIILGILYTSIAAYVTVVEKERIEMQKHKKAPCYKVDILV